jgi:hypothetical protein
MVTEVVNSSDLLEVESALHEMTFERSPMGFLDFPGEVRNDVYQAIIDSLPSPITPAILHHVGLAQTNKQIREEFITFILGKVSIEIPTTSSLWGLDTLLHTLPSPQIGRNMITHLQLPRFSEMGCTPSRASEIMDFCLSLQSLKTVTMTLDLDYLQMPGLGIYSSHHFGPQYAVAKPRAVAGEYKLGKLLELPELGTIELYCKSDFWYNDGYTIFLGLIAWIKRNFKARAGISRVTSYQVPSRDDSDIAGFAIRIKRA